MFIPAIWRTVLASVFILAENGFAFPEELWPRPGFFGRPTLPGFIIPTDIIKPKGSRVIRALDWCPNVETAGNPAL
jgi:hypothetical protein